MPDIREWLDSIGLGRYADAFEKNEIEWDFLTELDHDVLKDIGVAAAGHRLRILKATRTLAEAHAPDTDTTRHETPRHPDVAPTASPERRQLTVMFCDLVGSTALSQRLDPEDLREVNRAYQDAGATAINRFEGYVARYMGDGILAYFGYPQAHEDDARRAAHAALELVQSINDLNESAELPVETRLSVRVGIATGAVVVGDIVGESSAQERAVVGETPNLAARLQALAGPDRVVVSSSTRQLLGEVFDVENLGEHKLKGISAPVAAFRVVSAAPERTRFEAGHIGTLAPIVGREEETRILSRRWQQSIEGEGQTVLLGGEAGIGKSRIAQTIIDQVAADDAIKLRYQCSPYHANSALHPVAEQLTRAAGIEQKDAAGTKLDKLETLLKQSVQDIGAVAPLFAAMLSIPAEDRYAPLTFSAEQQKEETFEALFAQLHGLCTKRPVLFLFEDAQWADPTSLELVQTVIERTQGLPVMVVITFRPEFIAPWSGHTHVTSLVLNRFSRGLVADMITQVADGKALPQEVCDEIIAKTDGVPLFVEELTRSLVESDLLQETPEGYVLGGRLSQVRIPATLHDSLMARLDRLGAAKETAQTAAAIGREFHYDLLAAISPLDSAQLRHALEQLVDAKLVFHSARPASGKYVFKHAMVQDAAYQSLLKTRRVQLHTRIAKSLEQHHPDVVAAQPEILAQHCTEAGLTQQAVGNWLKAGRQAANRYAHQEAVAHLRRGLSLVANLDDVQAGKAVEIELQTTLGVSLLAVEGFAAPEVGTVYARAEELCLATGNRSSLYDALTGLWYHHVVRGEVRRAHELATRCLHLARESAEPARLLVARVTLCGGLTWLGEFSAACAQLEQALALEEQVDHALTLAIGADQKVFVRAFGSHALWHVGDFEQALRLSTAAIERAREMEDPFTLAIALDYAAMLHQFDHARATVLTLTAEAIEVCTRHRFAYYLAWARIIHGWAIADEGDTQGGVAALRDALAEFEQIGAGLRLPYYLSLLAAGEGLVDRPDSALESVDRALKHASSTGEHWHDADLYRLKGRLLRMTSTGEVLAESAFRQALAVARDLGSKARELQAAVDLGRLWCDQGKHRYARDLIMPVFQCFPASCKSNITADARALLDELS